MIKQVIKLWDSECPGYLEGAEIPSLTYYPASKKVSTGTVVICPGGGYRVLSPHEGEGYAEFFNSLGIDAFVLTYRVSPTRFPYPLLDARRAVRYVRRNADTFGIDKNKIAIMGSSAGGHLAALSCTYRDKIDGEGTDSLDDEDFLPNLQILCYPVIEPSGHFSSFSELTGEPECHDSWRALTPSLIADEQTPPAFIWHTSSDPVVDVDNTYNYAKKLRALNIPCEMHIFPFGDHGLGLANRNHLAIPYIARWSDMLTAWLKYVGFLQENS